MAKSAKESNNGFFKIIFKTITIMTIRICIIFFQILFLDRGDEIAELRKELFMLPSITVSVHAKNIHIAK